MATYNTPSIRYFKDDAVVENAFKRTFYGPNSSAGTEAAGYPDINISNVFDDITDYEITAPTALGANLSITSGDQTVTASGAVFSSTDVGKFLWNGADTTALKPIGKIVTFTDTTHVEVETPANTTYTTVAGYISDSATNSLSLDEKKGFYVLIGTEFDAGNDTLAIPSIKDLSASTPYQEINGVPQKLATAYINLKRLSIKGDTSKYEADDIPATITRVNFYASGTAASTYFKTTDDFPLWIAFYINPLNNTNKNLNKKTAYWVEINETLPTFAGGIPVGVPYVSESYGVI
jgi:hypothetical protein